MNWDTRAAVPRETDDVPAVPSVDVESTVRSVNGIQLHAIVAGDDDDPLVVLLHGFPDFWYGWREQIAPLVAAGYRVLVPDQRGYNRSEKPRSIRAYHQRYCTRDIIDLIATEKGDTAHVVGHDWGGLVAWELARRYPETIDRLVCINAPHPTAFRRRLRTSPAQLRRSWYVFSFQLPWLPEIGCRADGFRLLERALRKTSAPGTFTDDDLERYRRAWGHEGAISAMINWYRAMARHPPATTRDLISVPTLVVWGENDTALVPELGPESVAFCADGRLERLPDVSHWVPHEQPDRVTELVLEHVGG